MSKIPEGATHTYTESSGTSFRKMYGSYWLGYADGDWIILNNPAPHCYVPIQAEPEWDGEGLPPVGAIVYCRSHNRDVEILKEPELVPYVSAPCRALDNDELFWGGKFSPIKTPEQIEAESRKDFLDRAHKIYMEGAASHAGGIMALYDAGLRFTEVEK